VKLYFHHVGQDGARRDFPRTVFANIPITVARENIPDDHPLRNAVLEKLREKFPKGEFNCWGVPAGAHTVIKNLRIGDAVLLVETVHLDGAVPALCQVEIFYPSEFHTLSRALWKDPKYPFIFFFHTERLRLSWTDLLEHLGYSERFDPRGKFYSVNSLRPIEFPSQAVYVEWLRANYRA